MPTAYKILGQVATATLGATTEGTLYTVPSSTSTVVSSLTKQQVLLHTASLYSLLQMQVLQQQQSTGLSTEQQLQPQTQLS